MNKYNGHEQIRAKRQDTGFVVIFPRTAADLERILEQMNTLKVTTQTFKAKDAPVVQASMTLAQAEAYARGIDTDAHPARMIKYFEPDKIDKYHQWPNGTG